MIYSQKTVLDKKPMRSLYLEAENLIKKHDWASYNQIKPGLALYPLYPYLVYAELKEKIQHDVSQSISMDDIEVFNKNNPDFPLTPYLKKIWMKKTFKEERWPDITALYKKPQEIQTTQDKCYYLTSLFKSNGKTHNLKKQLPLWLVNHSQPSSCDPLFDILKSNGIITEQDIIARLVLVIQNQNDKLAGYLISQLSPPDRKWANKWLHLLKEPQNIMNENYLKKKDFPKKLKAEILTTVLERFAKADPLKALEWLQSHKANYPFKQDQLKRIYREISVYLSHQKHPKAYTFITSLPEADLDIVAKEWRIRLSIYYGYWPDTLKWIQALPEEDKYKHIWRYWQARAMTALGFITDSSIIYEQLSGQNDYYGILSSMRLNKPIVLPHEQFTLSSEILDQLSNHRVLNRVSELLSLKRYKTARMEWVQLIKGLSEVQLVHLAQIAYTKGWHDLSILAISQTKLQPNINFNFPLAFKKPISAFSQKFNIDPAWLFALTRQESSFFHHAVSSAGAVGLMQLMPDTAKYIANQKNIPLPSNQHLYLPEKNIEIGATYLRYLTDKYHKHPAVITASYNAGPGRTKQWLPKFPIEADIWIENIPFEETRHYVKQVMSYTNIYQKLLDYPVQLDVYLKKIDSQY